MNIISQFDFLNSAFFLFQGHPFSHPNLLNWCFPSLPCFNAKQKGDLSQKWKEFQMHEHTNFSQLWPEQHDYSNGSFSTFLVFVHLKIFNRPPEETSVKLWFLLTQELPTVLERKLRLYSVKLMHMSASSLRWSQHRIGSLQWEMRWVCSLCFFAVSRTTLTILREINPWKDVAGQKISPQKTNRKRLRMYAMQNDKNISHEGLHLKLKQQEHLWQELFFSWCIVLKISLSFSSTNLWR